MHHVGLGDERGVKVNGLWYSGPGLPSGRQRSQRGGRHKGKWVVRSDPRDARTVFFQDPDTHDWHTLRWNGLPPQGEVPSFGDARVRDMLAAVRESGLRPRSDAELLPVLLEILGAHTSIADWPTGTGKRQRGDQARDQARGQAAAADRASAGATTPDTPGTAPAPEPRDPRPQRVDALEGAVDDERRHRRRRALARRPITLPGRLGSGGRRSLFHLTGDAEGETARETGSDEEPRP
ncbi:hypothetical protein ALI22I_06510 [Saccharothrix sp. ALI-22-I]|uniref:hypothetical protein n=1 Tax=Saccharothrix sp. ALI-22-I TaxID=1933778 RepID=UPI0009D57AC5|nr:hypothetical protein [Saccharothrix sp. ALI-22-I]ONI91915.1 hypothetical protein ALI22I_06510 [Saccharothrix sp. ALI-22-I]